MNQITPGVIFDMDGVLIDSADAHFQSWRQLADEIGVTITKDQFAVTFGRQNNDIIPMLFHVKDHAQIKKLADRKEEIYRDLIRHDAPIVEGAVALVQSLHQAGMTLAIGSSGPLININQVLKFMGVENHFSAIVSADEITRGKPDPQVFSLACEKIGIPPIRCVVIEDAPAGVEAARSAGARCVAVLMHHPRSAFAQADLIVEKIGDLTVNQIVELITT